MDTDKSLELESRATLFHSGHSLDQPLIDDLLYSEATADAASII